MAVKSRTPYTSKGIVGTTKSGHTDMSILRSMCSDTKKNKMYDRKEQSKKPEAVAKRREKKRIKRMLKAKQEQ